MPPNILINIPLTFASDRINLNAAETFSLDLENLNDYLQFNLLGLVVSFIVAYITIDFFIKFINRIGFIPFILYRLVLGLALLLFFT